ncbi:SgcJ/EcaC family oxidoreductase [Thalassococcus sp. BH17M4-6]|uniref:SgcJ/EcaC family oxidoreductase n=1 Tax=Thalassococcus sp. BH17M4-6 TaxID=3413148 RepID=UPI003BE10261
MTDPAAFPQAFADAWHSREGAAIGALFAEDAEFVNVVGLWWHDRDSIAKAHDYALKSFFAETTLRVGAVRHRALGSDHALVQARFTLTGQTAPDGSPAGTRQTILSFVLRRDGPGWIAMAAQNTDVVPGAETHVNAERFGPADYRGA